MKQIKPIGKGASMLLTGLLIASFGLMIAMRGCTSQLPPSRSDFAPGSGDTINVAIDYSPLSLYRYADTLGGFNYDLIRMVTEEMHRPMKFHPVVSFSRAVERLESGEFDIIVTSTPATASFMERFRFTEPVYLDRQILVTRDSTVKSQLNLGRRTIRVVAGSPVADRLRHLSREIGDTIIVEQDSTNGPEQLFILAATGQIPMAVIDSRTAADMAPSYEGLDLSTAISFNQFQSWIMRPDSTSALADSIDTTLRRIKATKRYNELLQRYGLD